MWRKVGTDVGLAFVNICLQTRRGRFLCFPHSKGIRVANVMVPDPSGPVKSERYALHWYGFTNCYHDHNFIKLKKSGGAETSIVELFSAGKEPEPATYNLQNPARVVRLQLKTLQMPENSRYKPLKALSQGGIIMLRDKKAGQEKVLFCCIFRERTFFWKDLGHFERKP